MLKYDSFWQMLPNEPFNDAGTLEGFAIMQKKDIENIVI